MKKKLHSFFILLLTAAMQGNAQTAGYHYQATIAPVDSSGFYNIILTPTLNAHLKTDYSDFRVINDSSKWVPHLVRLLNDEIKGKAITRQLKIISNSSNATTTELMLQDSGNPISTISIAFKNAVTDRYCTLTGSDDKHDWFTINDSIKIVTVANAADNTGAFRLMFPPVNYKYFKVKIYNNSGAPLNIIGAGTSAITDETDERLQYFADIENPACSFIQKDSNQVSYIRITQPEAWHVEKISLKFDGVKFYNRKASLYIPNAPDHSFSNPGKLIATYNISSNSAVALDLPVSNARNYYLLIRNEDNLPLKTMEVKTYTKYKVATVYLEKSTQYQLLLNNDRATAAHYDLQLHDVSASTKIPAVQVNAITAMQQPAAQAKSSANNSTWLIWLSIGTAAVVLGFFTYRLVSDINKKDATI